MDAAWNRLKSSCASFGWSSPSRRLTPSAYQRLPVLLLVYSILAVKWIVKHAGVGRVTFVKP